MERTLRSLLAVGMIAAVPAFAGDEGDSRMMAVRMKKGTGYGTYYGDRPIYGVVSPDSDQKTLVLTIPGAQGRISIPRGAVESVTAAEALPASGPVRDEGDFRVIATTHVVLLKNGEKIRGDLVPSGEAEPIKLDVDDIGRLSIPRGRVTSVSAETGEIRVPKASPETPAGDEPSKPTELPPAESGGAPGAGEEGQPPVVKLSPELRARIEEDIYGLTRWRSRDRVRAERDLADIGAAAIPFLDGVAHDPFDLTRRAAMRIVRDVGAPSGIPIAIEGLLDDDRFVRESAAEALRTMTGLDLGYRVDAPVERRIDAYRRWVQWWREQGGEG